MCWLLLASPLVFESKVNKHEASSVAALVHSLSDKLKAPHSQRRIGKTIEKNSRGSERQQRKKGRKRKSKSGRRVKRTLDKVDDSETMASA